MENIDSIEKIYRSYFADKKIDFAFLYPTKTGLQKSIFDATKPIVDLLRDWFARLSNSGSRQLK